MASRTLEIGETVTPYPRLPYVEPCAIRHGASVADGHLWNLSASGAYVVAGAIPAEGETVQISFRVPDGTTFDGAGRVAWRNPPSHWKGCGSACWKLPPGFGVEFLGPGVARSARGDR